MAGNLNIHVHFDSGAQSEPSIFADLDSRTQRGAFTGLAVAARIYAAAFFLAYTAGWLIEIAARGYFHFLPLFNTITSALAISYALVIAHRCRQETCEACGFTRMATTFLVVSSLGIALQGWRWEQSPGFDIESVSWVGVWLVGYASIVTLAPKQLLLASLMASATVPVVSILSVVLHGTPADFEGSPWVAIIRRAIPVLICAGIGYAISYRVFCLARDVSKARRLGSYQLEEKIGSGGMGEVWRAKHRMLVRPAAVKLIRPQSLGFAGDETTARTILRRFEREAQTTALLTSPHSIVLYDFGIAEDGVFYYVMELLDGLDLKSLVRDSGPLPAERVVRFLRAVCDSLSDAHHRGLIHRDIKPGNLFACRRGREFDFVKVLDFGLVKKVESADQGASITQVTADGIASGTPGFMAPEMVTNEHEIDGRADIYSVGCVAYWLLTGHLVFSGKTPVSILARHLQEEPPPLSSRTEIKIHPHLERIVHTCLAKRPEERPQSAEALDAMLQEVESQLPSWTQDRAEQWWRANLPHLCMPPSTSRAATVAHTVINA